MRRTYVRDIDTLRGGVACGIIRAASKTTYTKRQGLESAGYAVKSLRPQERTVIMSIDYTTSVSCLLQKATHLFVTPHNRSVRAFQLGGVL